MIAIENQNMQTEPRIAGRDAKILAAVLSSPTIKEAAHRLELSETLVYKTMRKTAVKAEYDVKCRELLQQATRAAEQCLTGAVESLYAISQDAEQSGQTRVQASRALLEYGIKLVEIGNLDERVTALEKRGTE